MRSIHPETSSVLRCVVGRTPTTREALSPQARGRARVGSSARTDRPSGRSRIKMPYLAGLQRLAQREGLAVLVEQCEVGGLVTWLERHSNTLCDERARRDC